jgi:hypothetical protein
MPASFLLLLQRARKAAAMMQKPCEIVLVRHGETAWNKEGRLQGQEEPGPPLDDLGHQQAAVVGDDMQLKSSCIHLAPIIGYPLQQQNTGIRSLLVALQHLLPLVAPRAPFLPCCSAIIGQPCMSAPNLCYLLLQATQVLLERFPDVDAVISSDLLRAVQTAEVVAAGYQLQVR